MFIRIIPADDRVSPCSRGESVECGGVEVGGSGGVSSFLSRHLFNPSNSLGLLIHEIICIFSYVIFKQK